MRHPPPREHIGSIKILAAQRYWRAQHDCVLQTSRNSGQANPSYMRYRLAERLSTWRALLPAASLTNRNITPVKDRIGA